MKYRNRNGSIFCLGLLLTIKAWSASHHPQDFLARIKDTPNEGQKLLSIIVLTVMHKNHLYNWVPRGIKCLQIGHYASNRV